MSQGLGAAAQPNQVPVKWSSLGPWLADARVALVMVPGGTHVEGKVRVVEQDGLRMHVTSSSDKKAVPKGDRLIPRQSVSLLRVTKSQVKWRIVCALGAAAAAGIVVAVQDIDVYEGPAIAIVPAVEAAGIAGSGVAGYFIGKRLDRKVIEIRVVPEN